MPTSVHVSNADNGAQNTLMQELRERAEQSSALSRHLQAVQDDDRRKIARRLHDEIGQVLAAVLLELAPIKRTAAQGDEQHALSAVEALVQQVSEQVRDLWSELHLPMLEFETPAAAIAALLQRHGKLTHMRVKFLSGGASADIPLRLRDVLYRIAEQALTNVAQHSRAREVQIQLSADNDFVTLAVRDDGVGFDVHAHLPRKSLGIAGLRERAIQEEGTLTVRSTVGEGTVVKATFPVRL